MKKYKGVTKIIIQIIIVILTAIAHLSLIDLCVVAIRLAIPMRDYLAVSVLSVEILALAVLMVGMIYLDFKGESL